MFTARVLATGLTLTLASAAFAEKQVATGDFNGDGRDDLAIGAPFEDLGTITDCGVVHVIYGRGGGLSAQNDDFWHQNKPGILDDPEFGDHFGRTLAAGDFDSDGFDDLAIATDEDGGAGSVHVLYGTPGGLSSARNQLFTQEFSGGEVGSHAFGAALAVGDFGGDGFDDLAIGEPGDTVYFAGSAGSVTLLYGAANGVGHDPEWWHQQLGLVGEVAQFGDRFGAALAAGDFNGDGKDDLAVGAPNEGLGQRLNVGVVHIIYGGAGRLTDVGSQIWNQNSPGIADSIEALDAFGTTLAAGDFDNDGRDDLAIGVPFEKISSRVNAGVVHVLYGHPSGLRSNGSDFWHQDIADVPDQCDRDDEFGVSLTVGDFNGNGIEDLAIGIRGESQDDEEKEISGAVQVLFGSPSGLKTNLNQFWHIDLPNVPGVPAGARYGSSLAAGDFDGDGFDDLAGGAPGEKIEGVEKAGAVHILYGSAAQLTTNHAGKFWHQNIAGIADDAEASDGFGGVPPS